MAFEKFKANNEQDPRAERGRDDKTISKLDLSAFKGPTVAVPMYCRSRSRTYSASGRAC
jgi:hypothetical protein